jgi:hypothetical protein
MVKKRIPFRRLILRVVMMMMMKKKKVKRKHKTVMEEEGGEPPLLLGVPCPLPKVPVRWDGVLCSLRQILSRHRPRHVFQGHHVHVKLLPLVVPPISMRLQQQQLTTLCPKGHVVLL